MSCTFQRLPINGEYFISFLNSAFLAGQSIGKYFVNLSEGPVTTHTQGKRKKRITKITKSLSKHFTPCAFFILCQDQVACIAFLDGGLNPFAWRNSPVHIPPHAARGAVWPRYQMAKALLPVMCTLHILLPDPPAAPLVRGRRCETYLLPSRPLRCFHPPHFSRPSCMVLYRHVRCWLFPAESCVFCLSSQSCWGGGAQGSRTMPDTWRDGSVQKEPVSTHYGPSNPISTDTCFDYLKAKICSRKPVRYVFLDRALIWEYFLRCYLQLPLCFLDQCPLPG